MMLALGVLVHDVPVKEPKLPELWIPPCKSHMQQRRVMRESKAVLAGALATNPTAEKSNGLG